MADLTNERIGELKKTHQKVIDGGCAMRHSETCGYCRESREWLSLLAEVERRRAHRCEAPCRCGEYETCDVCIGRCV